MSMDRERRRAPRARYNNPIMLRVDVGTVFRGTRK